MNAKKTVTLAILIALAMIILAQAAVNVIVNTDVVAIDADNANMTVTLPKYGDVNALIECPDWNYTKISCPRWKKSELAFEQNSTHIWFTTQDAGAYAGILEALANYKSADDIAVNVADENGAINGNYTKETVDGKIILRINNGKASIVMKDVKTTGGLTIKTGIDDEGKEVVAVEKHNPKQELDIENATIVLPRTREISAIGYCPDEDFNFETFSCSQWQATSIPFTDNGDTITFTVEHFSAYSGLSAVTLGGVNLSKYGVANNQAVNYSGLVLWLKLEKGNGTYWNDSSGNMLNVHTPSGNAPVYSAEGAIGGAYRFDGINDLMNLSTPQVNFSAYTISIWIKMHNSSQSYILWD